MDIEKNIVHYMQLDYNVITEYVPNSPLSDTPFYFGLIEELPGCHAFGTSMKELLQELERVKRKIIESRLENDEDIPDPGDTSQRRPTRVRVMISGTIEDKDE